jgi:hypothetical protein
LFRVPLIVGGLVYTAETGVFGVIGLLLVLIESDGNRRGDEVDSGGGEGLSGMGFFAMALSRACGGAMPEKT